MNKNAPLHISERGLAFLKRHEGFSATAYKDPAGKMTIGFGHKIKPEEEFAQVITASEAQLLLQKDVEAAERAIHTVVRVALSQPQYDALISFVYNVGVGAFVLSTLLKRLNEENYSEAANELLRWNKLRQGKTLLESPGLSARRAAERMMFGEGLF